MGGGAMLTPVAGGAVVGGSSEPLNIPRTTTTNLLSHHPSSSYLNLLLSANSTAPLSRPCTQKKDSLDGREGKRASGFHHDNIFGPVPSRNEVEKAMSDFQSFMNGLSTSKSESNGLHQILYRYDPKIIQSFGYRRIQDAYHMLQTEPSVQRMVMSISSDKAVWDAILNNKAVQDLQGTIYTAKEDRPQISNEQEPDLATLILKWILGITKSKVVELIEKFGLLVNEIFQSAEKEKPTSELADLLEEKLRSSLLLSVAILLIVVVTRSHGV